MFNVRVYFFGVFGDVDIQYVVNVVSVGLLQHVFHLLVQLEVPLPSMAIAMVLPGIPTTLLSSVVIQGRFHLDVIFFWGMCLSIDCFKVVLNCVQFSSTDRLYRFSESSLSRNSAMSFFTPSMSPFLYW